MPASRYACMVAAHMDEVGVMLVDDEGDGIFRFDVIGGLNAAQLVAKSVSVGRQHVPGVIGRPLRLSDSEDRDDKIPLDDLAYRCQPGQCQKG